MGTRLPLPTIENILRDYLHPFRCDCHAQEDSHLTVRLYQCRDAANLVRLAQELRFELYATRSGMPVAADVANVVGG